MFFVRPDLTSEEIEKRVDDLSLFKRYCSNFKYINTKFKAEFRKDKDPSASITSYQNRLWYKDFGDPFQEKSMNIYQFIMRKYSLNFRDTLKKINEDFNLGLGYNNKKVKVTVAPIKYKISESKKSIEGEETPSKIDVKKVQWSDKYINFWKQYDLNNWDLEILVKLFKIFPISHFWLNTERSKNKMFVANDIGFTYDYFWYLGVFLRKIYLPSKLGSSFFTNCNKLITQGYEQLPERGNLIFITSSMKDIVILRACGFYAVAPSNENVFIQKHIYEELKKRFKYQVIFYDNDFNKDKNYGELFAQKHSKKYDVPYIMLPNNTEKDPSDFSKSYGRKELINVIKESLKYAGITY